MIKIYLYFFILSSLLFFQSENCYCQEINYKHSYTIIIPTNSVAEVKTTIDFLRTQFNSQKCLYNQNDTTYTLYLNYLINVTDLKNKIQALGYNVFGSIKHTDLNLPNSQLVHDE